MTKRHPWRKMNPNTEEKPCVYCGEPFLGGERETVCNKCIAKAIAEDSQKEDRAHD